MEEWAQIRAEVLKRAAGKCEHCDIGTPMFSEADHFLGGSGRRLSLQSVYTVWNLDPMCHWEKTNSRPNAAFWLKSFIAHCERYSHASDRWAPGNADGYRHAASIAQARLDSLTIQGRAVAR